MATPLAFLDSDDQHAIRRQRFYVPVARLEKKARYVDVSHRICAGNL